MSLLVDVLLQRLTLVAAALLQDIASKPAVDYTNLPAPVKYEDMSREIMCKSVVASSR